METGMSNDAFASYLKRLWDDLVYAGYSQRIWWVFRNAEDAPIWVDTLNDATAFFAPTIRAHLVVLIVTLHNIFDGKPGTVNLPQALKLAEKLSRLDTQVIAAARARLDACRRITAGVRLLRHNVFAHRNEKLSVDDAFAKAGLTPDDLRSIIDLGMSVLNDLSQAHERVTYAHNLDDADRDTRGVLKALVDLHDRERH
jgi:hypothetical protein